MYLSIVCISNEPLLFSVGDREGRYIYLPIIVSCYHHLRYLIIKLTDPENYPPFSSIISIRYSRRLEVNNVEWWPCQVSVFHSQKPEKKNSYTVDVKFKAVKILCFKLASIKIMFYGRFLLHWFMG